MVDIFQEKNYGRLVAGVDEVGRGPLAGPVMACAFVFMPGVRKPDGIADSKVLTHAKRLRLHEVFYDMREKKQCHFAVAEVDVEEIDRLNILHASMQAMARAVGMVQAQVGDPLCHILVDGNRLPPLSSPATALVGGDGISVSIGAASIIAKVARDRLMAELAREHPYYGWEKNAGYGTAVHMAGIAKHGVTQHHRRSFAPVRKALEAA